MLGFTSKAYCAPRGPVKSLLLFLFHLAWKSRIRLPVLIAVGFMVLDLRMQLEINIDLGMGGMQGNPNVGEGNEENGEIEMLIDESDVGEEDSDSILTDPSSYNSNSNSENSDDDDDAIHVNCARIINLDLSEDGEDDSLQE